MAGLNLRLKETEAHERQEAQTAIPRDRVSAEAHTVETIAGIIPALTASISWRSCLVASTAELLPVDAR
jgi:hypothetical protein